MLIRSHRASAIAAIEDKEWVEQCRIKNLNGLAQMSEGLKLLNLDFVPSQANFLWSMLVMGKKPSIHCRNLE